MIFIRKCVFLYSLQVITYPRCCYLKIFSLCRKLPYNIHFSCVRFTKKTSHFNYCFAIFVFSALNSLGIDIFYLKLKSFKKAMPIAILCKSKCLLLYQITNYHKNLVKKTSYNKNRSTFLKEGQFLKSVQQAKRIEKETICFPNIVMQCVHVFRSE